MPFKYSVGQAAPSIRDTADRQTLRPDTSFSFCYAEYWKTRPPGLRFNETIPCLLQGTVKQNRPLKTLRGFKKCVPSVRVRRSLHVRGRESRRSQRGFALCHSATEATDGFVSSHDGRSVPGDPSRGHPSGRGAHPPRPQSRPGRGVGLATLSRHPEGRDSLPYVHVESVPPRVPTVASFFSLPSL